MRYPNLQIEPSLEKKYPLRMTEGFSLIELMVVVSIVSMLSAFAIPKFAVFKIRAARAEMVTSLRNIAVAANAYQAEVGHFGFTGLGTGSFQIGVITQQRSGVMTFSENHCGVANHLAVSFSNCERLRYLYQFSTVNETSFLIGAISQHSGYDNGDFDHIGSSQPTSQCRSYPGLTYYFADWWIMDQNNVMTPNDNILGFPFNGDALETCFEI